jgi:hypothetical protein
VLAASCFLLAAHEQTIGVAGADDAYYYLTVARNAAHGHVSSFDGLSATNGYHPLWAILLTPLFLLVHDKYVALTIVMICGCILHGITLHVIWRMHVCHCSKAAACFATGFFALFCVVPAWYIGEAPLSMALFALFVDRFLLTALNTLQAHPARSSIVLGLCASAAVLSRLDAIFPVLGSLVWLWLARGIHARASATAALATMTLFVGAYVASNVLVFGHAVPISGVLKSSFPQVSLINYPLESPKWYRLLLPFLVALAFGWHFAAPRARAARSELIDRPLAVIAAGTLVFFTYEILFQQDADFGLYSWHFAVSTCGAAILAGRLFDALATDLRVRSAAGALLLGGALHWFLYRYAVATHVDSKLADAHSVGCWIDKNLPADAVIAATDPGMVAYFGDRKTISLDGLINDFHYQDALRGGRIVPYLESRHVTHLMIRDARAVDPTLSDFELVLPSRRYPGAGASLVVLLSSRVYTAPNHTSALFAWTPRPRTHR